MLTYILQGIKSDKTGKLSRWTLQNKQRMKKVHILGVVFHGEEGQHHIQPDPDAASKVLLTSLIFMLDYSFIKFSGRGSNPLKIRICIYLFFSNKNPNHCFG